MFERLIPGRSEAKQEEKVQVEAEKRQKNFAREQSTFESGTNVPHQDLVDAQVQEQKSDLIKWQQDLEPELMDLVYKLKGWMKVEGRWVVPEDCKPLCNDLFINKVVIPCCKPFLCRNMINTNLSEERILFSLKRTADDIADNMADGFDIYDIDFIDFDNILGDIKTTFVPGAFRALEGWTKKTDSTIFKRIESSFDNANETEKRKIFGIPA